jgi:hypothetical protein
MRTWFIAAAAATTVVLGSAGPAHALPPCGQVACEVYCGFAQVVSCTQPQPCRVAFTCSNGTAGNNPCACNAGCFLAGTKITMADRTEKAIESIRVGDMVLAYDEKTGELKPDRVSVVHEPVEADGYLVVNGKLLLTKVHPVLTPTGWKEIGMLAVGDNLIGADKKEIAIASIQVVPDHVTVYNFATNPYATYVANGVIVHNKNPKPTETPTSP